MKIRRIKTLAEAKKLLASGKKLYSEALTYQSGMEVSGINEWPDHKIRSIFDAKKDMDFKSLLFSAFKRLTKEQFFKVVKTLIDKYTNTPNDQNALILKSYMFPGVKLPTNLYEHGLLLRQAYPDQSQASVVMFLERGIPPEEKLEELIEKRKLPKTPSEEKGGGIRTKLRFADLIKKNHDELNKVIANGYNIRYIKKDDKNNDPLVKKIEQFICDYDDTHEEEIVDEMKAWYNGIKKLALSTVDIILSLPGFGKSYFRMNKHLQNKYNYSSSPRQI